MPTVLVVDDSLVDRRLAGMLLEKHLGCAIQYAADGREGLQQLTERLPDLVLTDLQMPEVNGLELVAAMKNDYPFVPVILMTAQGSEDIAAEALRQGAASYVPKRRLAEDLVPTVQQILLGAMQDRSHSHLLHYLEAGEAVFALPMDLQLLRALVTHLQQLLRCLPLADETERLRVGLAVEEGLKNAFYHGNLEVGTAAPADRDAQERLARQRLEEEPYRGRRIHVTARVSRSEAVFVIRDEGPGFDVARLPRGATLADGDGTVGRGVVLMRSILDEVRYNAAGNEVTLVKRRAAEVPAEEGADGQ